MADLPQMPASGTKKDVEFTISRTMRVQDILNVLPQSERLLAGYGLSCFNCSASDKETIEEGCRSHGMSEADIDDLMTDLNIILKESPADLSIAITEEAASALLALLTAQEKEKEILVVGLDADGNFGMETSATVPSSYYHFSHPNVPALHLAASMQTLASLGGATIDFRENRFKLDLSTKSGGCACKNGGECGC